MIPISADWEPPRVKTDEENRRSEQNLVRWDAVLAVTIDSFTGLFHHQPAQAAASIAYYFLFSIFPLALFMVIFLSYFLDVPTIQEQLVTFLRNNIPGSEQLVIENLQNMLSNRASTSLLASVTLLWSGSGMFNGIISNVQKAWPETRERGYFVNRFFAVIGILILVIAVAGLMIFSILFNVEDISAYLKFNIGNSKLLNFFTAYFIPILLLYLLSFLLYYVIPTADVNRKAARISAGIFAVIWRLFTSLFGAYVLSPMNRYDLIYGSVATIVILLLYMYFSAFIIIYPAHLTAALTHYYRKQERLKPVVMAPVPKKAPVKTEKPKKVERNQLPNVPVLDDPVILTEDTKPAQKNAWQFIKEFVLGLFRWK